MDIYKNKNIIIRKSGDEVTLSVIGDFDSSTTPLVHECCKKVQKEGVVKTIVLDFIKEHVRSDAQIFVSNLRDPEKKLLEILKIEKMIKVI